ncbi:hypothetical protein [Photobacterium ganghwense]|uniref:hypothetical protein n=1 Tax=Photobacterium ganghwense TaxID=320778 RepID=UPI001A8F3CE7|nr:hypothetical protein [Photobacterium ganghwense]QSV17522.1 hypothetical protein FH974_25795 [Photobacterium ganghwense]
MTDESLLTIRNLQINHEASPELFEEINAIQNSKSRAERLRHLATMGLLLLKSQSRPVVVSSTDGRNDNSTAVTADRSKRDSLSDNFLSGFGI